MREYTEPLFNSEPDYSGGQIATAQEPGAPSAVVTPSPAPTPAPQPTRPQSAAGPVTAVAMPPVPVPQRARTTLPVPVVEGIARYAAGDYAAAARALLPPGRAWSDDPAGVLARLLAGLAKAFERSDAALNGVLAGSLPGTLTALLPEWEAALGLPDPCLGGMPTIAQRLDQVRGRFVGVGGQSRRRYTDFAAALGFTIEVVVYKPGQANLPSGSGLAADSPGWMFVWGVRVLATTGALPTDVLMCELELLKPAETTVILL